MNNLKKSRPQCGVTVSLNCPTSSQLMMPEEK